MELLPDELKKQAEDQYPKGADFDQDIVAKFFAPWGDWTWYLMNKQPGKDYCWGIVDGFAVEAGSFSIEELTEVAGPFGLAIERDEHFSPIKAKDLWKELMEKETA